MTEATELPDEGCPKCGSKKQSGTRFHQSESAEMIAYERAAAQYEANPAGNSMSMFLFSYGPPQRPVRDPYCGPDEHLHITCKRCQYVRRVAPLDASRSDISETTFAQLTQG